MFKAIHSIDDVRPFVQAKPEIRFTSLPNGTTLGCYMFMDSKTFDSPESLECRGIVFAADGSVCSRPLHKFFNAGEKVHLMPDELRKRTDLVRTYEKLDGSMLATAWVAGQLRWRSKKAFNSDVVKLTHDFLSQPQAQHLVAFATEVAQSNWTAIFELTHPEARIVVAPDQPRLRLLHVRDNITGAYLLLDPAHPIHALVARYQVVRCPEYTDRTVDELLDSLPGMTNQEGYVLQFANGDMVKLKCPWYQRLHRSITFLRERDIALSSLNEELDDLKAVMAEAGIDLAPVNEVESRVKASLLALTQDIDALCAIDANLDRKEYALKHRNHPLFGLAMAQRTGKDIQLNDWFIKNRLKPEFNLRVLADGARAEAMAG